MAALVFVALFVVVAAVSPFLGADTSGDRYEDHPDARSWWPAGPDARPHYYC